MDELINSVERTLFDSTYDVTSGYLEMTVDGLLDDGILKEIPVVKTLQAVCKFTYNVRERNLLKQTLCMIKGFKSCNINSDVLAKYRDKIEGNTRFKEKELGRVLLILDQTIDHTKSLYLGKLYGALVKGDITWDEFCEMSEITRRFFVSDYNALFRLAFGTPLTAGVKENELISFSRLIGAGVVIEGKPDYQRTIQEIENRIYTVTALGVKYARLLMPQVKNQC